MGAGRAMAVRAALVAAALAGQMALAGCSAGSSAGVASAYEAQGQVNVAVVAGACANQPVHAYSAAREEIARAVSSNGYADVVVADTSISSELGGIAQVGSTTTNPTRRTQEEDAIEASLMDVIEACAADSPQTDVMRALRYAASGLAGCEGTGEVCLFHSGYSTQGVVDLAETPEWLQADPAQLAASLAEQLPDLSAIDVLYWYDLGYTAGDQPEPDQVGVASLEALWEALLTQAGVGRVEFVDTQVADGESASEYEVDVVDLSYAARPEVEVAQGQEATQAESLASAAELVDGGGQVEVPESEVGFVPDTAVLSDEESARAYIAQLAEALLANPDVDVYVTGSCAGCPWDATHGVELSLSRAQAVADILVSMGVDAGRLTVEGVGDQSNERVTHVPDIADDGVTQTDDAQLNRRVVITRNDG